MSTEVKEPIQTKIFVRNQDGTYTLQMKWSLRMTSLEVSRHGPTELYVSDITLEDIEKMAYDLLKIIEEESK